MMIPVAILGATGIVGRKFVDLLENHPFFKVVALLSSDRSVGMEIGKHKVGPCVPDVPCKLVFSALDSDVAGPIETAFQDAGYFVVTNAKNHRMAEGVPLLIPEVNGNQLSMLSGKAGGIVANPNCSTIGLCLALKPLIDAFGIEALHVTTMQALSGAGAKAKFLDIEDNVIPFISDEEEKIETEPLKIFNDRTIKISAQCNRVNVTDGHLECVSVKLKRRASQQEVIQAWDEYPGLDLPSAPKQPIHYIPDEGYPQPKFHRMLEGGMAVSCGRLRNCSVFDYKFVVLSHNTIRGAAGGAILCGELLVSKFPEVFNFTRALKHLPMPVPLPMPEF